MTGTMALVPDVAVGNESPLLLSPGSSSPQPAEITQEQKLCLRVRDGQALANGV